MLKHWKIFLKKEIKTTKKIIERLKIIFIRKWWNKIYSRKKKYVFVLHYISY